MSLLAVLLFILPANSASLDRIRECMRVRDSVYAATGDSNFAVRKQLECLKK